MSLLDMITTLGGAGDASALRLEAVELVMSPQISAITVFDVVWVLAAYAMLGLSALTLFNAIPS
jgi:hypothetical protein